MMEDIIRRGALRVLASESSCDVVISCAGYKLMAHKIILSIASPVLQDLLQQDIGQPTMLIFPEVQASTMTLILDYIYSGHVSLMLSQLTDFLSIASALRLKLEEDYVKKLRTACEEGDIREPFKCKFETKTNFEGKVAVRKKMLPGLIPIGKIRVKKGSLNKVIPSPWTQREAQVLKDPRVDCVKSMDCKIRHRSVILPQKIIRNDSNNNIVLETVAREAETIVEKNSDSLSVGTANLGLKQANEDARKDRTTEKITEMIPEDAQRKPVKEKPFKCADCGKSFSQLRNYKYHRSIHDGTKEFSTRCPECGKVFNDRGYLSSHMKIHRDRKEYACQYCPKRFNQRVAYNMHLRIHTGVKPHECPDCGKSFSRKMLLKQHQRVHTGERPYTCVECGKSFADRSNMSLHARLHTGVKPYSCTICSKSFTKKHHLKTHMNFHTGLKPYSCDKCGLAFSQSSNMRTHYKKCILKATDLDA